LVGLQIKENIFISILTSRLSYPCKTDSNISPIGASDLGILSDSLMEWRDAIKFKNREDASMFAA
jgi:hypothetical protein